MKRVILWLCLLAVPAGVKAGLGETIAETRLRLGEPIDRTIPAVKPADTAMWYQKDGFEILVGFYLGKSCYMNFSKSGQHMTVQEVKKLQNEQGAGVGWNPNPAGIDEEKLIRTDGLAIFTIKPYDFMQASQPNTPWFISKPWLEAAVDLRKKVERSGMTVP